MFRLWDLLRLMDAHARWRKERSFSPLLRAPGALALGPRPADGASVPAGLSGQDLGSARERRRRTETTTEQNTGTMSEFETDLLDTASCT